MKEKWLVKFDMEKEFKYIPAPTELEENKIYVIKEIKEVIVKKELNRDECLSKGFTHRDDTKELKGLFVTFEPIANTILWIPRLYFKDTGKLGSFIVAFTKFFDDDNKALEISNWINHSIKVMKWEYSNRIIEVVK